MRAALVEAFRNLGIGFDAGQAFLGFRAHRQRDGNDAGYMRRAVGIDVTGVSLGNSIVLLRNTTRNSTRRYGKTQNS